MRAGRVGFSRMDEVVFGRPAAEAAPEIAERMGAKRVFILASGTLNRETAVVSAVAEALGPAFAGLFDRMPAHTPRSAVVAAANEARAVGADMILTIGGGSVTDGAKAVRFCLANDIDTVEGIDAVRVGPGAAQSDGAPPAVPQVSVPTTLSAGEFSSLAGVTDERTKKKEMLKHPLATPQAVILDPAATVHTPEWLFLSTGVRAVDHCVEGVCSALAHPYGDAQALKALELFAAGMPRAKADPGDLEARLDCLMGAWLSMGPLASGVPMGASHGVGYVLGALHGVPHGHTSCVMLPATMRWNWGANPERQAMVAAALGWPGGDAADALEALIAGLGMPMRLSEVGVTPEDFDAIAAGAMQTPWIPHNPRPIAGPADVREILELAA